MVVILLGDLMANVQNLVVVESKLDEELVPIHHQHTAERTVVIRDQVILPENAILGNVQVR